MKNNSSFLAAAILLVFVVACSPKASQKTTISETPLQFLKVKETTHETVLLEAKTKNKLIFIDFYTTWCGPCKWMDSNVFADAEVATLFNKKFVNYKVDAEDFDGVNLALKYRVDAYPTLVFTDQNGNVLHRIEGMIPKESFLQVVEDVLKKE